MRIHIGFRNGNDHEHKRKPTVLGVMDDKKNRIVMSTGGWYPSTSAPPISMWFTAFLQNAFPDMKPLVYETV